MNIRQMSRQVSRGSAAEYQADEQAGVTRLTWRETSRCAGRGRSVQLTSNKQMSRQVSRTQLASNKQMSRQVSHGSAGEYQADEQAGVTRFSWRVSGTSAGRCRAAQLASIRQMSRQMSRGSAGEYQAEEQAGVVRLSWRVSGR